MPSADEVRPCFTDAIVVVVFIWKGIGELDLCEADDE